MRLLMLHDSFLGILADFFFPIIVALPKLFYSVAFLAERWLVR